MRIDLLKQTYSYKKICSFGNNSISMKTILTPLHLQDLNIEMSAQAARVARWHIFKTKNPNLGKFCS
jgi:hypothetical protein